MAKNYYLKTIQRKLITKKNPLFKFSIFTIYIILILYACSQWKGEWPDEPEFVINDEDIIFKMPFTENTGWDKDGNEGWGRWMYVYDNTDNQFNLSGFDLSGMLADNKVYTFEYSFYSNVDIDKLGIYFYTDNPNWKMLSNWTEIKSNIKKNNIYESKIIIIPNEWADGCLPGNIHLRFDINNRGVSDPAVLSFYKFTAGQRIKEPAGISEWDVTGGTFKITDAEKTFAEILPVFEGYNSVLHIKPAYGADNYGSSVIQFDLSGYEGKKIEILLSMFVYLKEEARIAWQINSTDPFYPVICGAVAPDWRLPYNSGPPLKTNEWIYIIGRNTIIVPYTGNAGRILYLSGQQIEGKEAYFANAEITITEGLNEDVEFIGVTADGSTEETTTWLTLTFDKEIPDLGVSDIILNGVDGVTGRMLQGEGPEYNLLISGFTSSGDLTVTVKKAGYTINDSPRVVHIYFHVTVSFNSVTADGSYSERKTTTRLTLNFNQAIPGLNENDIILDGMYGINKGTLSGAGSTYTLPVSGFTYDGYLSVTVTKEDYTINNSTRTVYIFYSAFDSAVGLKGLTKGPGDDLTVDTETGIISRAINNSYGNWFSVAIPEDQLPVIASDIIEIKCITIGYVPLMPKLPNSYSDLNPPMSADFYGDEYENTYEINAVGYGASIPTAPNAVVTFQSRPNTEAWKLKITGITVIHGDPIMVDLPVPNIRPVTGNTPVTTIDTLQYSGTVSWTPNAVTFTNGTVYTANITLTKKAAYTFSGIWENSFKVNGATTVTHAEGNTGDTMTITAVFPAAAAPAPVKNITFNSDNIAGYGADIALAGTTGFTATNTYNYEYAYPYFKVTFASGYKLSDYTKIDLTIKPINTGYKPVRIAAFNYTPSGSINRGNSNIIAAKETGNPIGAEGETKNLTFDITVFPSDADINEVYIAICIHAESGAQYTISNIKFYN
jgi:hypothetical protein